MVVKQTRAVVTAASLLRTLKQLGVREGGVLVVHASMSALGYVVHGSDALRLALARAIGPKGTLLVPTFSGENTDPECWVDPALPAPMWNEARDSRPVFDPSRTMPRLMGELAVSVLLDPDSRRSDHPLVSFSAVGPAAEELVADHDLHDPFGPNSPIGRARARSGQVLLLGVDQRKNSALFHAHCMSGVPQVRERKGTFLAQVDGERRWLQPERISDCGDGYQELEDDFVSRGLVRVGRAGDGTCRLMEIESIAAAFEHTVRSRPDAVFCRRPQCRQCAA